MKKPTYLENVDTGSFLEPISGRTINLWSSTYNMQKKLTIVFLVMQ